MALGAIKVGDSVQNGLDSFFGFVPNLIAFLVILVIGYIVAKMLKGIVRKALEKVGVDKALHDSDAGQYVERVSPGASPANAISRVVFWIAFVFVLTIAISALKIPAITAFMDDVLAYLPNIIAAIAIFVVAADLLNDAYDKGRENKERVKRDFETGKERAKDQADNAQQKVEAKTGDGSTATATATQTQPPRPAGN